jgi:hypothetical protein
MKKFAEFISVVCMILFLVWKSGDKFTIAKPPNFGGKIVEWCYGYKIVVDLVQPSEQNSATVVVQGGRRWYGILW